MIDVKGSFSLKMQSRLLGISMTVITRQAAKNLYRKITEQDAMWRVKVLMELHVQWKYFVALDYNQFVDLRGLFCCCCCCCWWWWWWRWWWSGGGGGGLQWVRICESDQCSKWYIPRVHMRLSRNKSWRHLFGCYDRTASLDECRNKMHIWADRFHKYLNIRWHSVRKCISQHEIRSVRIVSKHLCVWYYIHMLHIGHLHIPWYRVEVYHHAVV